MEITVVWTSLWMPEASCKSFIVRMYTCMVMPLSCIHLGMHARAYTVKRVPVSDQCVYVFVRMHAFTGQNASMFPVCVCICVYLHKHKVL